MFGARYPIILAPMAGGTSTPELVAAVCNAGGLGSIGAAYNSPAQIREIVLSTRSLTSRPFAVNLFAPTTEPLDRDPQPMLELLSVYHAELGLPPPRLPEPASESFEEQVAAVLELRPAVFSFTIGIPDQKILAAFRAAGTKIVGTATTVRESVLLETAGVDAIVAQGSEAGAHRGTFAGPFEDAMLSTMALVPQMARAVKVPVIASGGIMDGRGIRAAMSLGASAVQMGTAFLTCHESGAPSAHKRAVLNATDDSTTVTRVVSGRFARGIRNRIIEELEREADKVLPFPWQNAMTRALRNAAGKANRAEFLALWAGQAAGLARELPAAQLMAALVKEAGLDPV